jgi:alpha-glucuronidase
MWLQRGRRPDLPHFDVEGPDTCYFALRECLEGLERLNGTCKPAGSANAGVKLNIDKTLPPEGYRIDGGTQVVTINGADTNGLLYGVFAFLSELGRGGSYNQLSLSSAPAVSRRVINHWDNMTGAVERGYSGKSLFYRDNAFSYNPERIKDYARFLASVGINQLSINNVNVTAVSARLITEDLLPEVSKLAAIFRPYGIRLIISIDFESPKSLGRLETADPLDPSVERYWREAAELVYRHVPDLAGFLVKADSEFRGGPASIGRTQADGANVIARALAPFGGTVYWRCFVYNCTQDWRDTVTDRPKAAFENFYPLDGKFEDNVILQIKNGPSDFQVHEPNSPLFGRMNHTAQASEFQVTQEYTGQQIDLYGLAVQWQEFFDAPVSKDRITRELVGKEITAITAVGSAGDDENWTGGLLAQANLYAFGRLAWDPSLSARQLTEEWIGLTFGPDEALNPLTEMILASRGVYEKYNAPLGIGWMVNPGNHYGPSVDGYEYMKWGTYHRADTVAIGVDRTDKGTNLTAQYDPWVGAVYNSKETCPEGLLLFFHRLPYDYRLRSGKTLIQHIYDTHFEGAEDVEGFIETWDTLRPSLPEAAYQSVRNRLTLQLANAREWRDVVNTYFYRKTGIKDEKGRLIH